MTEFNPAATGTEAPRPNYAEQIQEQRREESLRPDPHGRSESARTTDHAYTHVEESRAANGDTVEVTASRFQDTGSTQEMSPEQARRLAEDTHNRILDNPQEAAEATRGTAQEPAPARISRAIDALN